MPDYHASTVSGSRYRRWRRIVIENPRNALPSATVLEEEIMVVGNEVLERPTANLAIKLDNPNAVIPLRDPTTWEPTGGSITLGELYAAIGSACWQAALERDAAGGTEG